MTIESICNQALDLVGYKRHIGSIWDGSRAARVALDVWSETRNALLVKMKPTWASFDYPLSIVKYAPDYSTTYWNSALHPEIPWLYEYATPAGCLVPLELKQRPTSIPIWRPRDVRFRISLSDTSNYTLLGNDPAPILTCINEVHNPDIWYEDFTEVMVEMLAKKFQVTLGHGVPQQESQGGQGGQGGQRANTAG